MDTQRFWSRVDKNGPVPDYQPSLGSCWLWKGVTVKGYGQMGIGKKKHYAHRLSYELSREQIPDGMVIDHLCRVPLCVNPDHLEVVTRRINTLRGFTLQAENAAKTHCVHGHPFNGENTYYWHTSSGALGRTCRACNRRIVARRRMTR